MRKNKSIRRTIEDWEEWIRPYVEGRVFQRRKNQYDAGKTESFYYSIKTVPFRLMINHAMSRCLKWNVNGICTQCGQKFTLIWRNMWSRKAFVGLEVCGRCTRKAQFTNEWKRHNSEAQKRIQGTPEARIRMSKRLKESWKADPSIRQRISSSLKRFYDGNREARQRISEISKRNWQKPDYQERVTGYNYHHGWFVSRCGRMFFASSWELMFLVWCNNNKEIIFFKRSCDRIPYKKPCGGDANYYPDFEIEYGNRERTMIVEIKGGRNLDLVERKRVAAEKFYQNEKDYIILYRPDLQRMGVYHGEKSVGKWILQMVDSGLVECYGFGKNKNYESFKKSFAIQDREREEKTKKKEEIKKNNRLGTRFPSLLGEWDYSANTLSPIDIPYWLDEKVWWICSVCGFKWTACVGARTKSRPTGCPQCGRKKLAESMRERMAERFERIELTRDMAQEKKNLIKIACDIFASTGKAPTRETLAQNSSFSFHRMKKLFGLLCDFLVATNLPLGKHQSHHIKKAVNNVIS